MFDLDTATSIVVSLSGGKDSAACVLRALEHAQGKPIICHHQAMPGDWLQTIPYCQALCARLGVPLVVEQAVYIRQPRQFRDGRTVVQRRIRVLDLDGRQPPWTRAELIDPAATPALRAGASVCGMLDFAFRRRAFFMSDPPIAIKYEHSLAYAGAEGWREGRTTFIQLFETMVSSGLMARLSPSAFMTLCTLCLASSPLGIGTEQDAAFFRDLVAKRIVSPEDRGRLFCCVLHEELGRRTGLGKNTLTRSTAELVGLALVEKREVRKPDGTRYNVYFILPSSHLDKYHVNRPAAVPSGLEPVPKNGRGMQGELVPKTGTGLQPQPVPKTGRGVQGEPVPEIGTGSPDGPLPKTGIGSQAQPVPKTGTNFRSVTTTTTTSAVDAIAASVAGFDPDAVLAHFARRKGVDHYRATSHDIKKLALLREGGYCQEEILAAIDQAFDSHPAGGASIRMFSYSVAIALATPPRHTLAPVAAGPAASNRDPVSPPSVAAAPGPDIPPVLAYAVGLYESEIGRATPLGQDELRKLITLYPDPAEWDTAFREAVDANLRQLRYVRKVLAGRAARAASTLPLSGGTKDEREPQRTRPGNGRSGDERRRGASSGRRSGPATDEELLAAQQWASAMRPSTWSPSSAQPTLEAPTDERGTGDGVCPACGGLGWLRQDVPVGHPQFGQLAPCEACGQVYRLRIARFDRCSSRKGRALRQLFRNFRLEGPAAAATEAYNAAVRFTGNPAGWLVLHGAKACGKSHLAAAIANYLIDDRGVAVLFLTAPDLLRSLRQDIQASVQGKPNDGSTLLDDVREAAVFILDDLGAERWTEWAEEQLDLVLDYRCRMELPTVVMTNEDLGSLPSRICSRLGDQVQSTIVHELPPVGILVSRYHKRSQVSSLGHMSGV